MKKSLEPQRVRPVRPAHAASLVLIRGQGEGREVLMGRRPPKSAFIPDAFVFPGGRLDTTDARVEPSTPLCDGTLTSLLSHGGCSATLARALATTAIRETYEETGLVLGTPCARGFGDARIAPHHGALAFLGRAITPAVSPIRFHARFFQADASHASGRLGGSGELLDLAWYPLAEAANLPAIDVTKFILSLIERQGTSAAPLPPFFRYRRNKPLSQVISGPYRPT